MKPAVADIWTWLDQVPDPEIPVISVVDLGIVRDVQWQGDELQVAVTPTYSGCPATSVISMDIQTALRDRGIDQIRVNVEKISQFGSTPCKAHWRCKDCLEPFDYFKCI